MVKRQPEERIEPTLPVDRAISLLKEQIGKIDSLAKLHHNDPEYDKWYSVTEQLIIKAFGKPHDNIHSFDVVSGGARYMGMSDAEWQNNYLNSLKERKALLEGFIEQLEKFGNSTDAQLVVDTKPITSRKVFIVHGHDDKAKTELALLLTRLDFEPIILHEKANEGLTLIEKLEKHSGVGYAFVLLTPDDIGCQKGDDKNLKPRARQNVVFEFGMFVGKLERNKVCCLYTGNVEWPSDLEGFVHVPFNTSINEKQLEIAKELKAAGYPVDFNKII